MAAEELFVDAALRSWRCRLGSSSHAEMDSERQIETQRSGTYT